MEDDGIEDDICVTTEKECDVNKRRLWCNNHDCDIKSTNVASKNCQYNDKKRRYMYVTKYVKKYVCPSRSLSRVQPMVTDGGVEQRTKPFIGDLRESRGKFKSVGDYSLPFLL